MDTKKIVKKKKLIDDTPEWWEVFAIEYLRTDNASRSYMHAREFAKEPVQYNSARTECLRLLANPDFLPIYMEQKERLGRVIKFSSERWAAMLEDLLNQPMRAEAKIKLLEITGRLTGILKDEPKEMNFNMLVLAEIEAVKRVREEAKEIPLQDLIDCEVIEDE